MALASGPMVLASKVPGVDLENYFFGISASASNSSTNTASAKVETYSVLMILRTVISTYT